MNKSLPTRSLPEHPDLDQLRRQAKELLAQFISGDSAAVAEVNTHYHHAEPAAFALHHAQLVLARAYGFESWPKLKAYVDGVTVTELVAAVRSRNEERVRAMLETRPELVNMDVSEDDEHRALHYAVQEQSPKMVRLLMQYGADARKGIWPNREATSALTMARERSYDEIVSVIEEEESRRSQVPGSGDLRAGQLPDAPIEQLMQTGDEARIIALLETNPGLRQAHYNRMTPVHAAAAMLWTDVLVWLLDHGADVNERIENGPSPLDVVGSGHWVKNLCELTYKRRSQNGSARRTPAKHSPRLGLPLGTSGSGEAAARMRCRSGRGWRRVLGETESLGREDGPRSCDSSPRTVQQRCAARSLILLGSEEPTTCF